MFPFLRINLARAEIVKGFFEQSPEIMGFVFPVRLRYLRRLC